MKKKNMNNKGFSLVELIIVIAIMAILIVVLAPQYLKYVEKSRNSTDLQSATEFKNAMEIYAADPEATETFSNVTITFTSTGVTGNDTAVDAALANAGLAKEKLKCVSKQKWDEFSLEMQPQTDGSIKWVHASKLKNTANDEFKEAMEGKGSSGT